VQLLDSFESHVQTLSFKQLVSRSNARTRNNTSISLGRGIQVGRGQLNTVLYLVLFDSPHGLGMNFQLLIPSGWIPYPLLVYMLRVAEYWYYSPPPIYI
jgi:hypothetical protein